MTAVITCFRDRFITINTINETSLKGYVKNVMNMQYSAYFYQNVPLFFKLNSKLWT